MNLKDEIAAGYKLIGTLDGVLKFALIGSAAYLPDAQDVDFAILLQPGRDAIEFTNEMQGVGWGSCGEYDGTGGTWSAIREGYLNLMVTHDPEFYENYVKAMEVCKFLNLIFKPDRIGVCQIIRDGKTADQALAYKNQKSYPGSIAEEEDNEL